MTDAEAKALYAKLVLAFPAAARAEGTEKVYVEALAVWLNPQRGLEAVTQAIHGHRDGRSLPTIAALSDEYGSLREKYAPPALMEPPMSAEQIAHNHEQVQKILRSLGSGYEPRRIT